ncbi:MAG: hypothetical protein R3208_08360 [Ketobacteraceae bacterium]|nr:hypothetical protein [Ketobacteraceae bacterium]
MRLTSLFKSCTVVLFSFLLMACGKYTIILPEKGAEYLDGVPDEFLIQYENQAPGKITLNGVDITSYFTIDATYARASGADLDGLLLEGENILSVKTGAGAQRVFYYDSQGPDVVNQTVQSLSGNQVAIQGKLKDPSADRGDMYLTLNNSPVVVDSAGNFSVTVGQSSHYRFVTRDALGHEATIIYGDRGNMVEDIVALEITESAINDLIPVFQEVIEEVDLSQGNPIVLFREHVGIHVSKKCAPLIGWPCIGPINFDIIDAEVAITGGYVRELTFADIDIKKGYKPFIGNWNGFSFDVVAEDGYVEGQTKINILGLSDTILTLLSWFGLEDDLQFLAGIYRLGLPVDRFHVAATLAIDAENGDLNAKLISLDDLGMGPWDAGDLDLVVPDVIKNFPFGLMEALLNTIFNGLEAVRDIILRIIGEVVAPLVGNIFIDLFLKEVPQIHLGVGFDNGSLFSALIATDRIKVDVASSGFTGDDRLVVSMNGRIGAEALGDGSGVGIGFGQPAENFIDNYFSEHFFPDGGKVPAKLGPSPGIAPQALGFRFTETALPDPATGQELAVNISSNMINQTLLAIYESGLTTVRLPLNAEGQSLIITDPENANAILNLTPTVPTQVVFKGSTNAVAYLRVANFTVSIDERDQAGEWKPTFQSVISADVPVQFSTAGEDGLSIALLSPSVDLAFGAGPGSLQQLILKQLFLDMLIQQINTALTKIQLPEDIQLKVDEAGIEINPGKVHLVGQPKEHLSFESNFNAL